MGISFVDDPGSRVHADKFKAADPPALSQPEICPPTAEVGSTVDVVFDLLYRVGRQPADDGCTDARVQR